MLRWGAIGRLACAAAVIFSLAGVAQAQDEGFDDLPALEDDLPADDMPGGDLPPLDDMPVDDMPDMPADDLPPPDDLPPVGDGASTDDGAPGSAATLHETPAGDGEAPVDPGAEPLVDDGQDDAIDLIEVKSYYPAEEREFGAIEVDYRGPFEFSFYTGWAIHDGRAEVENGGSLHAGTRIAANFGQRVGLDVDWTITRINLIATRRIDGNWIHARGEVSISTFTAGLTYRFVGWRMELFTPYVRLAGGLVYFNETEHKGMVNGTPQVIKFPSTTGAAVFVGLGLDYKMARNWTFRGEVGLDVWVADWLDRREVLLNANVFRFGLVWHFDD